MVNLTHRIFRHKIILIILNLFSWPAISSSLDIRGEYENWNSGLGGTAQGKILSIAWSELYTSNEKLAIGGELGSYSFDRRSNASIDKKQVYISISTQRFYPNLIFVGYRILQTDYNYEGSKIKSFTDITHGPGIGLARNLSLSHKMSLYSSTAVTGLLAKTEYKSNHQDRGFGYSLSAEVGVARKVNNHSSLSLGVKLEYFSTDYGSGSGSWDRNNIRVPISYGFDF